MEKNIIMNQHFNFSFSFLLTGNAENTVMQALESLNDNQVNDFLSGKSPLNLSVRLGDHLMMIQVCIENLFVRLYDVLNLSFFIFFFLFIATT